MAKTNHPFLKDFRGSINKIIVVKQYPGDRTIITAYPDMSRVKPTAAQLAAKTKFAAAVAYAQHSKANINLNILAEKRLRARSGTLYHALIKEFMENKNPPETP